MKRIANNWICWVAIAGLIVSGCSVGYVGTDRAFSRGGNSHPHAADFFAPGIESFQAEEFWVIERNSETAAAFPQSPEPGGLKAVVHGQQRELAVTDMDVNAAVKGYIATVNVTQRFQNPYAQRIEAVYVFSMPRDAAVDDFIMTIGKRRIRGVIRERKEAEAIYQEAKRQGYLASLLTANHANTFRQTIANIEPGNYIDVRIHYFQVLQSDNGWYEFFFPMRSNSKGGAKPWSVPVSLHIDVQASAPIADLECPTHFVTKKSLSPEHWTVELNPKDGIPYLDFRLRYRLANEQSSADLMTYRDERGGYFTLMLHPPNDSPALTNVKMDWGAMQASEIYPGNLTNLPAGRAVLMAGRFNGTAPTTVTVTGTAGNQPVSFFLPVDLSRTGMEKSIPKIWASMKIGALESEAIRTSDLQLLGETRQVALDYGLASPFTSFLAVDANEPTEEMKTITVPAVP